MNQFNQLVCASRGPPVVAGELIHPRHTAAGVCSGTPVRHLSRLQRRRGTGRVGDPTYLNLGLADGADFMILRRMRPLAENLWCVDRSFRLLGAEFGVRSVICRLPDGGLWVHSPVALDDDLVAVVDGLGPVRHLVAPNTFHHLFIGDWVAAYADASVWAAKGLARKRPDLAEYPVHGDDVPAAWQDALSAHRVAGMPALKETVFLHRASRTLIVTDLFFHNHHGARGGD